MNYTNPSKENCLIKELIFDESAWLKEISSIKKANRRLQNQIDSKQKSTQTQDKKIELKLSNSEQNEESA